VASAVVASPANPPPVVFVLDANSDLHAARVATWDQLATTDPVVGSHWTTPYGAELRLREGEGKGVAAIFASFARSDAAIEATVARRLDEEPVPEHEEDESTVLDEGRMGKKHTVSETREGVVAKALERSHRFDHKRVTEVAGARTVDTALMGGPDPLATAVTEWMDEGALALQQSSAVLLAAPSLRATELIALVARLHPRIAVALGTTVRPLRIETSDENDWERAGRWIELRLGVSDLTLEAVPETLMPVTGPLDQASLAAALDEARSHRDLDPLARVDVLVDPHVDVQRLIDMLVALEQVGVRMVGLGEIPATGSTAAAQRGHRHAELSFGQPNAQGDLEKKTIREFIKHKRVQILACYERAAVVVGRSGTVQTQFFITPNGSVATSSGSGVDPNVANCVADVIKTIEFPKPKGGGGVQVNYPFTFRR
jgi:hypothetical protein